jgi:hypothetical protein
MQMEPALPSLPGVLAANAAFCVQEKVTPYRSVTRNFFDFIDLVKNISFMDGNYLVHRHCRETLADVGPHFAINN